MFGMLYSIKGLVAALGSKVSCGCGCSVVGSLIDRGLESGIDGDASVDRPSEDGRLTACAHAPVHPNTCIHSNGFHFTPPILITFSPQNAPTSEGLNHLRTNAYTLHHYEV